MITLEQLKPFCSTDDERIVINEPASHGAFTWATDGRILVRVPRMAEVPEVAEFPPVKPTWDATFDPSADFQPLPPLPDDPVPEVPCEECEGDGWRVCLECGTEHSCGKCRGAGIIEDRRWTLVGGHPFKVKYLHRIAALPDPRLAVTPMMDRGKVTGARASFIFDGGHGVLMGLKPIAEWAEGSLDHADEWKPDGEVPA